MTQKAKKSGKGKAIRNVAHKLAVLMQRGGSRRQLERLHAKLERMMA